jgi:nucleoside diphosphate kinase
VQKTYAMLKPDVADDDDKVARIKAAIASAGLAIVREERATLSRDLAAGFYAEHAERDFYDGLLDFMCSGPILKLELEGEDAIQKWRALLGPTSTERARAEAPDSLRALFGTDGQANAAHGSDSPESAERELQMMFDGDEQATE